MDALPGLVPDFYNKLNDTIEDCAQVGVIMKPYFGVRDPITQAKLWRQSRSVVEISTMVARLRGQGCNFLADCIVNAGPTTGPWATNAIPGLSWHQYGEAEDCMWMVDGTTCWSTEQGGAHNGYLVYMALAEQNGLTAIGRTMHKDFGHVQLRPQGAPDRLYGLVQIDSMMRDKFGSSVSRTKPVKPLEKDPNAASQPAKKS